MSHHAPDQLSNLKALSVKARNAILHMTTLAASGHPGGSMSSVDLLLALYNTIDHDPKDPAKTDRDRVVVSNGHISPAVYAVLGLNGYFDLNQAIAQFRKMGSIFEGHIERTVPGVEWSTGNLGQGLSAGVGFALAAKLQGQSHRVFVMMGDGEQQKGQISEARRLAVKYSLSNLTAVIDYNELQISGSIHQVMPQNIRQNWEADGWDVLEIDGHDYSQILDALAHDGKSPAPRLILAHTVMGKGVSFMENQAKYHGSTLSEEQLKLAVTELGETSKLAYYRKMRADFKADPEAHNTDKFALKTDLSSGQPIIYEQETDNRSAWGKAIADLGQRNLSAQTPIAVLDCDLAASVKTGEFAAALPDRFIQCGIMEHNTAVVGGALSSSGIQTFWSDFGMFGIDEVYNMLRLNDINHANLKIVVTHVGIDVGEDGKTHQCIDYIGLLRNLYGFRLILPADPNQTDRVIRWLINKPGNYVVAMGRSKLPIIRKEDNSIFYNMAYAYEYGTEDLIRLGNHGSVFVTGTPASRAIKAIDSLRDEGIYLNLFYVSSPLEISKQALETAAQTGHIFSIEDHNLNSGMGSIIAEKMNQLGLQIPVVKIGVSAYPFSGTSDDIYKWAGLDAASLLRSIKQHLT